LTTKQRFIAEAKQVSNTTPSIYRDLIKMLISNPLELGNSNNQELAKNKPKKMKINEKKHLKNIRRRIFYRLQTSADVKRHQKA